MSEFDGSAFHDVRVMKSLVEAADLVVLNRGKSFSAAVGDRVRQSAGGAFSNLKVNPEAILSGHYSATADRCSEFSEVLVAQDTMVVDYSSHRNTAGLGPISKKDTSRGVFCHGALAMTQSGTPLGLLSVNIWARETDVPARTDEERHALPIEDKESYKWIGGQNEIGKRLAHIMDRGIKVIVVGDRENDIIEVFAEPRHLNMDLLVRLMQPRTVEVEGCRLLLPQMIDRAGDCGEYILNVPAKPGRSKRLARMLIKHLDVELVPPKNKRSFVGNQLVSVVHAYEPDPPVGEEPIVWTLLSTRKVASFDQALKAVEHYTSRWIIERLHYTLKTGVFNVERLQFHDFHTLANALAFYYIMAWNVLSLVYLSREYPNDPAEDYIDPDHLFILRRAIIKPIVTILQAVKAIAELAGYANYPKSPLPGVKMIWMGVEKINAMVAGARLYAQQERLQ